MMTKKLFLTAFPLALASDLSQAFGANWVATPDPITLPTIDLPGAGSKWGLMSHVECKASGSVDYDTDTAPEPDAKCEDRAIKENTAYFWYIKPGDPGSWKDSDDSHCLGESITYIAPASITPDPGQSYKTVTLKVRADDMLSEMADDDNTDFVERVIKIYNHRADITYADITDQTRHAHGEITVNLTPGGLTGTLKLELINPQTQTIREATRNSGTYHETFDTPNLQSVMEHKQVKATWTVNGVNSNDLYDHHIKVLGTYSHTRYHTPQESAADCGTDTEEFAYTIGKCGGATDQWYSGTARSLWLEAVELEGDGFHSTLGFMTMEEYYSGPPDIEYHLRQVSDGPCSACSGMSLIANGTVAIMEGQHPAGLECGDTVFIHSLGGGTGGTRTVTDTGSGVGETQLDHYNGLGGCGQGTGLGNSMTVKIYDD